MRISNRMLWNFWLLLDAIMPAVECNDTIFWLTAGIMAVVLIAIIAQAGLTIKRKGLAYCLEVHEHRQYRLVCVMVAIAGLLIAYANEPLRSTLFWWILIFYAAVFEPFLDACYKRRKRKMEAAKRAQTHSHEDTHID